MRDNIPQYNRLFYFSIDGLLDGKIQTGDTDDTVTIKNLNGSVAINVGEGTNSVDISTGAGDDSIVLQGSLESLVLANPGGNDELRYIVDADKQYEQLNSFAGFFKDSDSGLNNLDKLFIDLTKSDSAESKEFSLDAFFGGSPQSATSIYIDGDDGDLINTDKWVQLSGEIVSVGDIVYDVYSHSDNLDIQIFIQQQIITSSS